MNVDSFFTQGYSHPICEDYALSNSRRSDFSLIGEPFACLSDGCSTGIHTDIGARLLCHLYNKERLHFSAYLGARKLLEHLGLSTDSILATLIAFDFIFTERQNVMYVDVCGDGVIVGITNDDTIRIIDIEYPKSTPFYLHYLSDMKSRQQWNDITGNKMIINGVIHNNIPIKGYRYDLSKYKAVYAFSDGIKSFIRNRKEGIELNEIISYFLPIINNVGEFVKRRANKVLKRLAKDGIEHYDDFSMIGFVQ